MRTSPRFLRAIALALPALFLATGCDDDDDNGGTGPDVTLMVQAVLSGNGGTVTVSDGGVPVTGATVSLNGTPAGPGATDGEYTVTLAPPVAPGGNLTLDVSQGGADVQATGTVPEAPVITAPTDGSSVPVGEDVEVTWTSTADPDGWLLTATSGATTVTATSDDGSLRALTITGASLAAGDWTITLHAVHEGVVTGDAEAGSSAVIRTAAAASPTITVGEATVLVIGNEMSAQEQVIEISQGGVPVDGATVTVNGEAATQAAAGDPYAVTLAAPLVAGDPLDLDITIGATVIQGTGTLPEGPVVTAPADASGFALTDPIDVTWTSTTDPDRFVVRIDTGTIVEFEVDGAVRTYNIPAGTLPAGTWTIQVFAYNDGEFTGPVESGSAMNIRGDGSGFPSITIAP